MVQKKQKCGCLYCKGISVPTTRAGWEAKKNRKGFKYGSTRKSTKGSKPQSHRMPVARLLK